MKYELEALEQLIAESIDRTRVAFNEPDIEAQWIELLQHEIERAKRAFIKESFSLKKDKHIEVYIQHHQGAIIHLWDSLPSYSEASTPLNKQALQLLHFKLGELLSFVEKHFSRYFDLAAKIPESYRSISVKDFSEKLPVLASKLRDKGLRVSVINLMTEPLKDFVENDEVKISFRKLIYLKELYNEILELSESEVESKEVEKMVCTTMIYMNYNSPKFLTHCAKIIKEAYQAKSTLTGQLEKLSHYLKLINQQQEKPGFSLKYSQKSLKVQLSEWVIEEIIFLERKQQLSFGFKIDKTEAAMQKGFKIMTESSVPQVAYFVRILMETGLIKNQSTIDVIRFFSTYIRTSRVESISADSFRSKFYNTEQTAKDAVKDDVLKLLNHIKNSN